MSATSGGGGGGGGGSVSENSDAGESSQSTLSIRDSPSTSFQIIHNTENVMGTTLNEENSDGGHGEIMGSKINLTMNEKHQNDGVVNMGFDYEEGSKTGEVDFTSANGSNKKDKVPEAVNLELVNMVPYSNGNSTTYGVPINGIPTKKDSESVDMSTPYDEYFVPVNEHKKYMRGEKLYVTKDKRRPTSWRRCLSWVIAGIVIAAVLIVAILAGTGVILSQEQNMVKEASVGRNFDGANLKPLVTEKSSRKTPMPQINEPLFSPTTDMTYMYVPKTIESELIVDNLSLDPALLNKNSTEYQQLTNMMEKKLKMILFNQEILDFGESQVDLKVINISENPFKFIYRIGWQNKQGSNNFKEPIKMEDVKTKLLESLKASKGYIDKYHIDMEGIKVGHVINKCQINNDGCSHICYYNYLNQRFTCTCPTNLILDNSRKKCVKWIESTEQDYASVPEHNHHFESQPPLFDKNISGFHHSGKIYDEVENVNQQFDISSKLEPTLKQESKSHSTLHHKHHEIHDQPTIPLPEPTPEPSFEFTSKLSPQSSAKLPSEFAVESSSEPTLKSPSESVVKLLPGFSVEPSLDEPTPEPLPDTAVEPSPEPVSEPSQKPASDSSSKFTPEASLEPVVEPSPEPVPEPSQKPAADSPKLAFETSPQPAVELTPEPTPIPRAKAVAEPELSPKNTATQSYETIFETAPESFSQSFPFEPSPYEPTTKSSDDHFIKVDSNSKKIVNHESHPPQNVITESMYSSDEKSNFDTEAESASNSAAAFKKNSQMNSDSKFDSVSEDEFNSNIEKISSKHKITNQELKKKQKNEQNQESSDKKKFEFNQESRPLYNEEANHEHNNHPHDAHLGHGNENYDTTKIDKTKFKPTLEATTFSSHEININTNSEQSNKIEEHINFNDFSPEAHTTSVPLENKNFKNTFNSSIESNTENFADSMPSSIKMLNNNKEILQNEHKDKNSHSTEEISSGKLGNTENKVPLLEDILLRSSSWNSSVSQINLTVPRQDQNWLKNIELNSKNQPIIEEIIIEKPDTKEKKIDEISTDKDNKKKDFSFQINNTSAFQIEKENIVTTSDDLTNSNHPTSNLFNHANDHNLKSEKNLNVPDFKNYETQSKVNSHHNVIEYNGFENEVKDNNSVKPSKQHEINKNLIPPNNIKSLDLVEKSSTDHSHLAVNRESVPLNPKTPITEKSRDTTQFSSHEINSNASQQSDLKHGILGDHIKIMSDFPTDTGPSVGNEEINITNPNEPNKLKEEVHLPENLKPEKGDSTYFEHLHPDTKSKIEINSNEQSQSIQKAKDLELEKPVLYSNKNFSKIGSIHSELKEAEKPFVTELDITTMTPKNLVFQKVTDKNIINTEVIQIPENTKNRKNEEAKFTTNYSSNIKNEGADNEEFNTLLGKDYLNKNENGNDSKEVKVNKYPNKQIFLKGDKKKIKDFAKSDKIEIDKKIIYETTKPSINPEDFVFQKHINNNDNNFTKDLQSHGEGVTKSNKNASIVDTLLLDNVPSSLFKDEEEEDNDDFKVLLTIAPEIKAESIEVDGNEKEKGIFKTKGFDEKEEELKAEKDYSKFEKDYKYEKQKGTKKKDLKKKGGVKDGKNVELTEVRKYMENFGKEENVKDEFSAQTNTKDSPEIYTNSFPEGITTRPENLDFSITKTEKSFQSINEANATETSKVSESITNDYEKETNQPSLITNHTELSNEAEHAQNFKSKLQISTAAPSIKISENSSFENDKINKNFANSLNDRSLNNNAFDSSGNFNSHEIKNEKINDSKVTETYIENAERSKNSSDIENFQPIFKDNVTENNEYIKISKLNHSLILVENNVSIKANSNNKTKLLENVTDSVTEISTLVPENVIDKRRLDIIKNNKENFENFFVTDPTLNESTKSLAPVNILPETIFDGIHQNSSVNNEKMEVVNYPTQSIKKNSTSFENSSSLGFTTENTLAQYNSEFLVPHEKNYNTSFPTTLIHDQNESVHPKYNIKFDNNSFASFNGNASSVIVKPNVIYNSSDSPRFTISNYSHLFENGSIAQPSIVNSEKNDKFQNKFKFNEFNVNNSSFFTSFPNNKTIKNSVIYKIQNDSLPGILFNGHFNPHTNINSSEIFGNVNKTNQSIFTLKGQSGDFGNSTIYILENDTVPTKPGTFFKNFTTFTINNITEGKTLVTPKKITSQIISNNSSPFISLTPTSFSSGTAYQVNDYFGYISKCASGQFQCINGTSKKGSPCINLSSKCDSINDCSDGSDEIGCIENGCPGNFQCLDGTCLKRHLVCNGITDCNDGSDETQCEKRECEFDELRCSSGRCIPIVWHCDGKPDCDNHTDEINCQLSCGNDEFMCPEGWCIPLTYKCNGIKECTEGEDEQFCDCSHEEFKCEAGGCISKNQVCNGIEDCPDRSDEWNCLKLEENTSRLLIRDLSGEYQPVCSDNWNTERSNEVCASLGYFSSMALDDEKISTISTEKSFYILKNDTTEVNNKNLFSNLIKTNECSSGKLVQINCQEFICGSRSMMDGNNFEPRLIGGMTASAGQWPSVALLHNVRNFLSCTANILTPRWILSSYNCLRGNSKNVNQQDWKLFSGLDVFEAEKESKENSQVIKIIPHPQIRFNQFLFSNDLALVELDEPLQFSNNVGAICLPEEKIQPRQICVTAGWGISSPTGKKIRQQLQYLPVPTMNLQECNSTEHYSGFITNDKICAGYNTAEKSLCYNEEGAPLMCVNERGEWEIQGVLSYHSNCGRGSHPSIFSSIMHVKNWIKETIGNRFERRVTATKR